MKHYLLLLFVIISIESFGSNSEYDRILKMSDTSYLSQIEKIALNLRYTKPDSILLLVNHAIKICDKYKLEKRAHTFYQDQGDILWHLGRLNESVNSYMEEFKICDKYNMSSSAGTALANAGYVYSDMLIYDKALELCQKGFNIVKQVKDEYNIAVISTYLAHIYTRMEEYQNALDIYKSTLDFFSKKDSLDFAKITGNIGEEYSQLQQYDSAKVYFFKSLHVFEKLNQKKKLGILYAYIAKSFYKQNKLNDATYYYNKAIDSHKKYLNLREVYVNSIELADIMILKGNLKEAKHLLDTSLSMIINNNNDYPVLVEYHKITSKYFEKTGQTDSALFHFKSYSNLKDSLSATQKLEEVSKMQTIFQMERKDHEIETQNIEINKQKEIALQEKKQKIFLGIGLLLAVLLVVFVFRGYRQKQKTNLLLHTKNELIEKQKEQVELQKDLVQEKNKEIIDSINYAKRLQDAILPPRSLIKENLNNFFVLYKPKDIVAGDFYWFYKQTDAVNSSGDGLIFLAAADCTGHGVPGALVSVVCSNALDRAVKEFKIVDPAEILNKVTELVIETFEKSESEVKDGMDISLCSIDLNNKIIKWCGANNPLWIVRNSDAINDLELIEIKPDKQSVGKQDKFKSFNTHEIKLAKDDTFYLFTDGFADQFGGPKGKKYKYAQMKELLLSINHLSIEERNNTLDDRFEDWKGQLEQIDDVTVIGVQV